ncbi:MAG: CBS domain-containing protein [Flavobacteriales bacterium]|nr:CBS domain-containing protein [Flavobacteriia bacterium]NCP05477.1 CBS domain-containing protein [Flavobacteriales bacterium]PIV93173.1 MAG: nucleotidyltransferase [Flavobacteriaceae bacterium CG17_big_fil_post_rev_8_21_14_2_50_33_15]PIY09901.1 MAG: nucleotidyltransferase [Flavobacteriaceae bacterium CG_4_10_14_3_um_filter_33_47]PJB17913.1 MAG: nucleotidyltransferase [Flavobacteriaceae bacterium CG_4_9_14_3_um_filter_33_16]
MNTIAERIYDFLKGFPPFSMLAPENLRAICKSVEVHYVEKDSFVFKTNELVKDTFYVVKDGDIGLFSANNELVDECDEGDIFGLRALMRQGTYVLSAKAIEESIVYSISSKLFDDHIAPTPEASKYLMSNLASNYRKSHNEDHNHTNISSLENTASGFTDLLEEQTADYSKNPIVCSPETSIKEAATLMTEKRVGSIIITHKNKPLGIITDKDLRTKIATGTFSIHDQVKDIMSSPVITYPTNITVAEAQIAMIKHKITHLCITEDGTVNSELTGILSEHDIIVIRENNASVLIKEIKRTKSVNDLKQIRLRAQKLLNRYIEQQIPITFASKIITEINNSITCKLIENAVNSMPTSVPTSFAWLAIGSQGREEQLLLTDQDNSLVFNDVPKKDLQKTQSYFLELSKKVTQDLNTVGFEFCPANMMASNPKWCLSLLQWKAQFKRWITSPDQDHLMLCTILFDFEPIYGNKELVDEMAEGIFDSISHHEIFLNHLGVNALKNPPPLSFFRQFLVEQSGEHKDQFDIKARAMMPLVDAARLLILSNNIKSHNNTILRYKKLMELEPQNKDLYNDALLAFKNLLQFRTEQGLKHHDSGRFIDLKSLSKVNRLQLKNCFKTIKDIQELILVRFNLSQFL